MGSACSVTSNSEWDANAVKTRSSFTALRATGSAKTRVLKPGSDFTESYTVGKQQGSDKSVTSVVNIDNEVEHMARSVDKSTMPMEASTGDVEEHFAQLAKLDHVHICRFIEAYEYDHQVQLIYERATVKNLFEMDKTLMSGEALQEEAVQIYCRQIASALQVAHKSGVVHGRLSATSILSDPSVENEIAVKICDMGQTYVLRPPRAGGTLDYNAPETLWDEFRHPSDMEQMNESIKAFASLDMWALGILLFRMLTGTMPFAECPDPDKKKEMIKSESVKFSPDWAKMPDARDVVQGLLRHNGRIRLGAEKVLKHPWLMLSKEYISRTKMIRILQNVVYNTQESTFKKFALRVIAEDMAQEKIEIVQKAFQRIDRNNDGSLEVREISDVLRKYLEDDGQYTDEIFEAIDRDASGSLNFAEFSAVSIGRPEYCDKEVLWHVFNRFDRDGNGSFDQDEIARTLREVEQLAEGAQVTAEVEEIAGNIAMPMDFDTFVHIMITPAGQNVNSLALTWDKMCYQVMKVDNQKVRHITPRPPTASAMLRTTAYSRKLSPSS